MTDEPSNAELGRLIGALRSTLDNRFSELNSRLHKRLSDVGLMTGFNYVFDLLGTWWPPVGSLP
ncbi:hypothetical protein ACH41H_44045 [Streptomyces sp. NPDC020800]|uniref:hypothetical protein n=1 Tax=Streptomyces sp. NPDC020800 TaxID=3365092 RepID=UPI0037A8075D